MKYRFIILLILITFILFGFGHSIGNIKQKKINWSNLDEGIQYCEIQAPKITKIGDYKIKIELPGKITAEFKLIVEGLDSHVNKK